MAAKLFSAGRTLVGNPGTPQPVAVPTSVSGPGAPGLSTVHAVVIQALTANTGKVYVGLQGLDKSSLANVLVVLPIPTANLVPSFSISLTTGANALSLSDLYIDADIPSEGVLISGVVA